MLKKLLSLVVMILSGLGFGMLFATVVATEGSYSGSSYGDANAISAWLGWGDDTLGEGGFGGYLIFFGLIIIFLIGAVLLLVNCKKEIKIILGFVAFVLSIVIAIFAFMGTSTFMVTGDGYDALKQISEGASSFFGQTVEIKLGAGAYILAFASIAIAVVLLLEAYLSYSKKGKKKRK